jgi:hypothetical protein
MHGQRRRSARRRTDSMGAPVKHAMSLEEIAQAEGTSVAAVHMLLTRALRKLRRVRASFARAGSLLRPWTPTGRGLSNEQGILSY